jgi:hypothetical protein
MLATNWSVYLQCLHWICVHANVTITRRVSQALTLVLIKHVFCFLRIYRKDNYNPPVTRLRMSLVFQTEPLRLVSKYNSSVTFYTYIGNELRIFRQPIHSCTPFALRFPWVGWERMWEANTRKDVSKKQISFMSNHQKLTLISSITSHLTLRKKRVVQQLVSAIEECSSGNLLPSSSRIFDSFDRRQKEARIL